MDVEYRTSDDLPEGVDAVIVDLRERVVLLVNPATPPVELCESLTRLVAHYREHGRPWIPLGRVS